MNGQSSKHPMYYVAPTSTTPMIKFVPKLGLLELKGKSSPENPMEFYAPLNIILDKIEKLKITSLETNLEMEYFNTSSLKCFFNLLKKVSAFSQRNIKTSINWYYESDDDDIFETGEDLAALINHEFQFIEVNSYSKYNQLSA